MRLSCLWKCSGATIAGNSSSLTLKSPPSPTTNPILNAVHLVRSAYPRNRELRPRKLACMIYHLLQYKEEYIDVDCLIYLEKIRKSRIAKLCKQAEELGFEVIKKQKAA